MSDPAPYSPPQAEGPYVQRAGPAGTVALILALGCALSCLGFAAFVSYRLTYEPMASDEDVAVGSLWTLQTAQRLYVDRDPDGDGVPAYGTLAELSNARYIDRELGRGTKRGYLFRCTPSAIDSTAGWLATASPLAGSRSTRCYAVKQDGQVHVLDRPFPLDPDAPFPPEARPLGRDR